MEDEAKEGMIEGEGWDVGMGGVGKMETTVLDQQ